MITRDELRARLADLAADVFHQPAAQFTDDLKAVDVPLWDSLNHVKLLVFIEEAFGLRFGNADLHDPQNWGEFVDLIEAKLAAKA